MDHFKIKHFEHDYSGSGFPWFRPLESSETQQIRRALAGLIGMDEVDDNLLLTKRLHNMSSPVYNIHVEAESFDLALTLDTLGMEPQPYVYVNWYRYDEVDCIRLEDLSRNFKDLWYPGSDDIDIFDNTLLWVLSVTHSGPLYRPLCSVQCAVLGIGNWGNP